MKYKPKPERRQLPPLDNPVRVRTWEWSLTKRGKAALALRYEPEGTPMWELLTLVSTLTQTFSRPDYRGIYAQMSENYRRRTGEWPAWRIGTLIDAVKRGFLQVREIK